MATYRDAVARSAHRTVARRGSEQARHIVGRGAGVFHSGGLAADLGRRPAPHGLDNTPTRAPSTAIALPMALAAR